jgi:hypothetical protein
LTEKEVRAAQAKKDEKAAAAAVAEKVLFLQFNGIDFLINVPSKVRLAYEDDRKMKLLHDELEKERRDARIAAAARRAATRETAPEEGANEEDEEEEDNGMPGTGNVLGLGSPSNESGLSNNKAD